MNYVCPICRGNMQAKGKGALCGKCGFVRIESPVADQIIKDAKRKKIYIITAIILFVWVIPSIILFLLK